MGLESPNFSSSSLLIPGHQMNGFALSQASTIKYCLSTVLKIMSLLITDSNLQNYEPKKLSPYKLMTSGNLL
jgi:hypothetical protein